MSNDPIPKLKRLLGERVVFLSCAKGSKAPRGKWGHSTIDDMTANYLGRLKYGNIGVALGEVSDGLCAIDFDRDDFAERFRSANPQLKGTLQTHGARGRVFWVRFIGEYAKRTTKLKTRSGENVGEFRSNGAQSIIWGIHPDTGQPYQVVVKQPVIAVKFDSIRWPDEVANPPTLQSDGDSDVVSVSRSAPSSLSSLSSLSYSVKSLEHAVEISLPEREHQNNACLFTLARALKVLEAENGPLTWAQKSQVFSSWYEQASARGALRKEQSRDKYLVEFLHACKSAKIPLGSGPAEQAWAMAITEPFPAEAAVFESQEGKLLVAICFQLHRHSKGGPWFLAARTAARLIGTTPTSAAKWLTALVEIEILQVAEPHTNTKATRYRYLSRND